MRLAQRRRLAEQTNSNDPFDDAGSRELARATSAWLACLAFVIAFAIAMWTGTRTTTAIVRGGIVALAVHWIGFWLFRPAVAAVLAAMARDRALQAATVEVEEDDDR
jgi:hypothetical protein